MTTTTAPPADVLAPPAARSRFFDFVGRYGVLVFLLLLVAAFSILLPGRFFTPNNGITIITGQAIPIVLAIACLFPLAAGEFDLSLAANLSFCAIWSAWSSALGWPLIVVFISAIAIGAIIGAVNAFFIVRVGVNAFIATLAMGTILAGFNLLVTNGELLFRGIPDSIKSIGTTTFIGLPMTVWIMVALAFVTWYVLEFTPYGRYIRATGSGREAARLSGVRTAPTLASVFIVAGAVAALAGFLQTSWIGSANPTSGPELLLPAYAAAFLGATVIQPGLFNLWGTLIGAFVLAVGISGLVIAGAPFWLPNVFNGAALLIAVSLSVLSAKRRGDTNR